MILTKVFSRLNNSIEMIIYKDLKKPWLEYDKKQMVKLN